MGRRVKVGQDRLEALVVGAGPAGLCAATHLARAGVETVVVDARPEIGVPLRCGEFTADRIFDILNLEPRPRWIRKRMGKSIEKEFVVLNREVFEQDLAALLFRYGVMVVPGTRVVDVGPFDGERRPVRVATDRGEKTLRIKYVVAADGAPSRVARCVGIDTYLPPDKVASGVGYRVENASLAYPEDFHIEPLPHPYPAYPYYLWVIPNGPRSANVGLYLPGRFGFRARPLLDEMFERTEAIRGGDKVKLFSGVIPDARPLEAPYADGVIVVGGAARLIEPRSGGGIGQAIASGRAAAEQIISLQGKPAVREALIPYWWRIHKVRSTLEAAWKKREWVEERLERGAPLKCVHHRDWAQLK